MQRARPSQHAAIVPTISERAQAQGPDPAEWERIKPVLQRLYVVEKRPLRDVVNILDQHHGFRATYVSHHFGRDRLHTNQTPENVCLRVE